MIPQILALLRRQSNGAKLSVEFIAAQLHASVPATIATLLLMRKAGQAKSWGSGLPVMLYWSI